MRTEIRYKIDTYIMLARTTTNEKLKNEWCNKAAELLNDFVEVDNIECSDSVSKFMEERLVESAKFTKNSVLFEAYILYCKEKQMACVNNSTFGRALSKHFTAKVKKDGKTTQRGYMVEVFE